MKTVRKKEKQKKKEKDKLAGKINTLRARLLNVNILDKLIVIFMN
jgi:hypothetical protein